MAVTTNNLTVVILAGGRATRLPGKLQRQIDGEPLLERVYRRVRDIGPVVLSVAREGEMRLGCREVVDRWPDQGPLAGLLSACGELSSERVFAVAGDAPNVDGRIAEALLAAWRDGDEAAVPEHGGVLEPLAAIYLRTAIEREGPGVLAGDRSMHALLARLRVRRVPLPAQSFANINTLQDLGAIENIP